LSNLLKHAERELKLIGYDDKDEYDKMAKEPSMMMLIILLIKIVTDILNHFRLPRKLSMSK